MTQKHQQMGLVFLVVLEIILAICIQMIIQNIIVYMHNWKTHLLLILVTIVYYRLEQVIAVGMV